MTTVSVINRYVKAKSRQRPERTRECSTQCPLAASVGIGVHGDDRESSDGHGQPGEPEKDQVDDDRLAHQCGACSEVVIAGEDSDNVQRDDRSDRSRHDGERCHDDIAQKHEGPKTAQRAC